MVSPAHDNLNLKNENSIMKDILEDRLGGVVVDAGPPDLAQHVHPRHQVEALPPELVQTSFSSSRRLENHTIKIL